MTQTYTDDVLINSPDDEVQLIVRGSASQASPLQQWEDSSGIVATITKDGRFQNGDDLGLSTPDALIEAHRDDAAGKPSRGFNSLGRFSGTLTNAISWLVSELELVGSAAISGIHTTIRGRVRHTATGDSSAAELRAGDFEVINESGTSLTPVGEAVGIHTSVNNQDGAYLDKARSVVAQILNATGAEIDTAIGLDVVSPDDMGTINALIGLQIANMQDGIVDNYAIHTGLGVVHLGDVVEMPEQTADPANKAGVLQFYAKSGKLFAKAPDPDNTVYDLTQSGGGGSADYFPIEVDTSLEIPTNRQIVVSDFEITTGTLTVNGRIQLL